MGVSTRVVENNFWETVLSCYLCVLSSHPQASGLVTNPFSYCVVSLLPSLFSQYHWLLRRPYWVVLQEVPPSGFIFFPFPPSNNASLLSRITWVEVKSKVLLRSSLSYIQSHKLLVLCTVTLSQSCKPRIRDNWLQNTCFPFWDKLPFYFNFDFIHTTVFLCECMCMTGAHWEQIQYYLSGSWSYS